MFHILMIILTVMAALILLSVIVIAGEAPGDPDPAAEKGRFLELTAGLHHVILGIAFPTCALWFAVSAFLMITGDEKKVSKAKTQMLYSCIALALLLMLPVLFDGAANFSETMNGGWKPPDKEKITVSEKRDSKENKDSKDKKEAALQYQISAGMIYADRTGIKGR